MRARDVIANHRIGYPKTPDGLLLGSVHADAILSALEAAGYAVVPVEPTEAMLQAKIHIRATGQDVMESRYDLRPTIWKVMLAAAKETP